MNKLFTIIFLGQIMSFIQDSNAPEWKIDKVHSSIGFEVTHFFTPVAGEFKTYDGVLKFDPDNLAGSSASFIIQVTSIDTDNSKRDDHLQSADFFNAEKFPEIAFKSTSFSKSENGFYMDGELTIRDITKNVKVPFKILGIGDHPTRKNRLIAAIKGELIIGRNEYGVGSGNWSATAVVGEEVKITMILEATRPN